MALAVLFLVLTGCSWIVVGAIIGLLGRRNLDVTLFQVINASLVLFVSGAIALVHPEGVFPPTGIPTRAWVFVVAGCLANGLFNYFMIECMGLAMRRGPNGAVWAIIQSGLVFPFLMGTFVFGEPMSAGRLAGILLILGSIVLYSMGKREPSAEGPSTTARFGAWFAPALLGFACCGMNQCGANLPSFVEHGKEFPSAFRTMLCYVGLLLPGLVVAIRRAAAFHAKHEVWVTRRQVLQIAAIAAAEFTVSYLAILLLQFPALDRLESLGRGSMGYPIMVGSCIAGFFPYGVLVLHEKVSVWQVLGAIVGITGICLGSLL